MNTVMLRLDGDAMDIQKVSVQQSVAMVSYKAWKSVMIITLEMEMDVVLVAR